MDRYSDCLRHMADLQGTVDNIRKCTNRKDIEALQAHAKKLLDQLFLKVPYIYREIRDLGMKSYNDILSADAKAGVEAENDRG